jgi:FkbM family methyltransferase
MGLGDILFAAGAVTRKVNGGRTVSTPIGLRDLVARKRANNEAVIRLGCQVAYLGDHTALCRVLGRYKMFVDTRDVGLSTHLMLDGYWEMWITEVLASSIQEGMVVADIGANVGYFTLLMADLVGPKGRVHAFEPNPELTKRLVNSVAVNGYADRVALHEVALGEDQDKHAVLVVPPNEPKNGHMIPYAGEMPEHGTLVATARLDAQPDWAKIEVAKIDVEGAEQFVWAGMRGLLEGSALKTVVLEFTPARYACPGAFIDTICASGFVLAYIDYRLGITPTTREWLLAQPPCEDIMLYLRR